MISRIATAAFLFVVLSAEVVPAAEDASQTATLHLYRQSRVVARIYRSPIRINGEPLLNLANGSVWSAKLPPGTYKFAANDKDVFSDKDSNVSAVEVELRPGQTVYIRAALAMGARKANTTLAVVPEEEGSKAIARLKPVRPADVKHPAYRASESDE